MPTPGPADSKPKPTRLDAQVLSRYAAFDLAPDQFTETEDAGLRAQLKDLLRRGEQPAAHRGQETTAPCLSGRGDCPPATRKYETLLQSSPARSETAALYQSVPGVGQLTAATLVADLPELDWIDGKTAVALAGLAPWSRDSIQGGRGKVRRVLYLAAQSAARYNVELREFYRGLRARSKPGRVALVTVMQKAES